MIAPLKATAPPLLAMDSDVPQFACEHSIAFSLEGDGLTGT